MDKTALEYQYYIDYRAYLINIIHKNENFYQVLFLIYILILYIFWIKTDIFSLIIYIIISVFIIDWIYCKYKTIKLREAWDKENS